MKTSNRSDARGRAPSWRGYSALSRLCAVASQAHFRSSVLCAVVVFVLGLSAAVSPPQALAAIERVHPASMCGKLGGGANITRVNHGIIVNNSPTAKLFVTCDVVNELDLAVAGNHPTIKGGTVSGRDRNPSEFQDIYCTLLQSSRVFQTGDVFWTFITNHTNGAAKSLKFLSYGEPDPNGLTGFRSNNFFFLYYPTNL
jgi:hypothetical protein